ncbi:MAG: hypothetical protein FWG14_07145 [Peptococcaceae bacterium]|nr:hypothetical protein [Peptococcaceae bacterium]
MLKVCDVKTNKEKTQFIDFAYGVYRNRPFYRDTLNYTCENFLYQKDFFSRSCRIKPIMIHENGDIAARCAYIAHPGLNAAQIALFEALPEKREAADIIIDAGRTFAVEHKADRVLIGLNGHTSYGVGFQCDHFDDPNPFDSVYTQEYYLDYFRNRGFTEHEISTYYVRTALYQAAAPSLLSRIYNLFTFRKACLRNLRREMDILGALFNETLKETPFFFPRPITEWYELFKELKPILRDENIIYVLHKGVEVGFLFWHPNYNMVLSGNGKNNTLSFFMKYLLRRRKITEMKINALGVMPEYSQSGAVMGLFHELYSVINGHFDGGETGFVFDSNAGSASICQRFCGPAYKHYVLFEDVMTQ